MSKIDNIYHSLLNNILSTGYEYLDPNRKKQDVYRRQINHFNFEYDLKQGFPALTTKKLAWKSVVGETLWILRGDTNINYLVSNNINIWSKDAYNYYVKNHKTIPASYDVWLNAFKSSAGQELGEVGKNYGYQLRSWTEFPKGSKKSYVDQLATIIHTLKTNPMATKKVVTYWNPAEKEETALTPCHRSWEVMVRPLSPNERAARYWSEIEKADLRPSERTEEKFDSIGLPKYELSLSFDMSSVDTFLGLPFNIASYALITHILAKLTNMEIGTLYGNLSNVHIYNSHITQVEEQLNRDTNRHSSPILEISNNTNFDEDIDEMLSSVLIEDFVLEGYSSFPAIKTEMLAYDR